MLGCNLVSLYWALTPRIYKLPLLRTQIIQITTNQNINCNIQNCYVTRLFKFNLVDLVRSSTELVLRILPVFRFSIDLQQQQSLSLTWFQISPFCTGSLRAISRRACPLCMLIAADTSLEVASSLTGSVPLTILQRLSGRRAPCATVSILAYTCEGSRFFLPIFPCGPPHAGTFPHICFSSGCPAVRIPAYVSGRVSSGTLGSC